MKLSLFLGILLILFSSSSFAEKSVSRADFLFELEKMETMFQPWVTRLGGELIVRRDWRNNRPIAYARKAGRRWMVHISGGLARKPSLTLDGLMIIACHELGHLIGGAPHRNQISVEGQSDYFATLKCMKRLFRDEDNSYALRGKEVPPLVRERCRQVYSLQRDRDLCHRVALASLSASETDRLRCVSWMENGEFRGENRRRCLRIAERPEEAMNRLRRPLSFETEEQRVVRQTYFRHNSPQCRLDTLFAGTLCDIDPEEVSSFRDPDVSVCQTGLGARPSCWYSRN